MQPALDQLAALAERPDTRIDLPRAALQISRLVRPDLDPRRYLGRLDALAEQARIIVTESGPLVERVGALNAFLFERLGFSGNEDDFYDPRNSFLDQVLDRRIGIPITLSLVYTAVGTRAGLPLQGVGFPGHFLVKAGHGAGSLMIDVFSGGRLLTESDLNARLDAIYGAGALSIRARPALLGAATHREILVRMLRNLKSIYLRREETARVLDMVSAILALVPDLPEELRDRGLLYRDLGHMSAALADLRRFSALSDNAEEIAEVARVISELETRPMRLH